MTSIFVSTLAWTPRSIPIIGSYIVDMMKIPFVRFVWWWNIEGMVKFLMKVTLELIKMPLKVSSQNNNTNNKFAFDKYLCEYNGPL